MSDKRKIKPYMIVCTVLLVVFAAGIPLVYRYLPRTVNVVISDAGDVRTAVYETQARSVKDFLKEENIDYDSSADLINTPGDTVIRDGITVNITKAFDIDIKVDGTTVTLRTIPVTVSDALKKAGVTLGTDDLVEPSLDTMINKGEAITVTRVTYETVSEQVITAYGQEVQYDDTMPKGEEEILQQGQDQVVTDTYRITLHDGKQISKELTSSEVTQEMKNEIISIGTSTAGVTESGMRYSDKFQVRAVAYTAEDGAHGAYGGLCRYGTVAVDPSVIPLGTRLYIEGYGYAYANDTGGAIKGYTVDLFMESDAECFSWGSRYTTVYILS